MNNIAMEVDNDNRIAIVYLNRPLSLNALTSDLCSELCITFRDLDKNSDVRAVVLTGNGRAFCAGADIKEMRSQESLTAHAFLSLVRDTFLAIENIGIPVIAAINGVAYGGGFELALACDLRIAVEEAKFSLPEIELGIMPTGGATQRLPRIVGMTKAKELIFTSKKIGAQEAMEIGMLNTVVTSDQLMAVSKKMAYEVASKAPFALRMAKASLANAWESSFLMGLNTEITYGSMLWDTKDKEEGMKAFIKRRNPGFRGD